MTDKITDELQNNFNKIIPRSIFGEADPERLDKKGQTFTGGLGYGLNYNLWATAAGAGANIYRNPSRRFYDPEITTSAIYLPRNVRQKNRWCRWFFDHDEHVGTVLELHAELPHSRAELIVDDPVIKRHVEECFDKTELFSRLPMIDLEFMKIGEVFIHTPWDSANGMWSHIIIHNPDYVELTATPFADSECVVELKPDDELRKIIYSTKPEDQALKRRLPKDVVRRVLTGKNILLDSDEVTHIARRSNPYDIRGTSLINRMFRLLMYEDKLREAQITIADNFIYPLKVFKLGDPQRGWIPDETHQRALAQMLQQAHFDPHFSLIYHYGLSVDYVTVADKVMRLDKEYQEISERKLIALGVSKEFIAGTSSYASANVGLQIQLARYKAKRDLFEIRWIREKFLRILAERNEWYKRDAREILGHYRVKRTADEMRKRLIIPKLAWHKKLMLRDDQQFLTFLHNVYSQGKGPVSAMTLLMAMGLDAEGELSNKKKQKQLEEMIGAYITTPAPAPGAAAGAGGGMPGMGPIAKLKQKLTREKTAQAEIVEVPQKEASDLIAAATSERLSPMPKVLEQEKTADASLTQELLPVNNDLWDENLKSPHVAFEVIFAITAYDNNLKALTKKYNGQFAQGVQENVDTVHKALLDIYLQGKLSAYKWTNFLPIQQQYYAQKQNDLRDYSDMVLANEFKDWIIDLTKIGFSDQDLLYRHLRNLSNSCYAYGQLKGFQEQGIYNVKVGNSMPMDGLRYKIEELTGKGKNLASLISPYGEIIVLSPCIECFDDAELGNMLDHRIALYKNLTMNGINIKNCPIEFVPNLERYLNKLGKYLKKQADNIYFIKDVVDLPEWNLEQRKALEEEFKEIDEKTRSYFINTKLMQEQVQKRGKVASFKYKKDIYVSNWIGSEDVPLTANLMKYLEIDDDTLKRAVEKNFRNIDCNLTAEELKTYNIFGYITPVRNDQEELIGWKLAEDISKTASIDEKIFIGKVWSAEGNCTSQQHKDPIQIFNDNLRLWLDYPQKLNKDLQRSFESI
jgi:hypothetical protein